MWPLRVCRRLDRLAITPVHGVDLPLACAGGRLVAKQQILSAQLPEHLRTPATGGGTPGTASAQRKKATPKAETQADGAKKRALKRKLESGEAA